MGLRSVRRGIGGCLCRKSYNAEWNRNSPCLDDLPTKTQCFDVFRSPHSRLLQNMPADAEIKQVDHLVGQLNESLLARVAALTKWVGV